MRRNRFMRFRITEKAHGDSSSVRNPAAVMYLWKWCFAQVMHIEYTHDFDFYTCVAIIWTANYSVCTRICRQCRGSSTGGVRYDAQFGMPMQGAAGDPQQSQHVDQKTPHGNTIFWMHLRWCASTVLISAIYRVIVRQIMCTNGF